MPIPVLRLLTDFVCLYTYEFWLSLCKIIRSSVILLLPLFQKLVEHTKLDTMYVGGFFFIDDDNTFTFDFQIRTSLLNTLLIKSIFISVELQIIIIF